MYRQSLLITALLVTLCVLPVPLTSAQTYRNLDPFNSVWRHVKHSYFDPTFGGVNWDKVREKYEPLVLAAKNEIELHDVLRQMLSEIDESHFEILTADEFSPDPAKVGIGIDLQIIGGVPVITWIEPESQAARAGIRPGFVVKQIDQIPVEQAFERFAKSKMSASKKSLRITRALLDGISGKPGTAVRLVYHNESDQSREVTIERAPMKKPSQPGFQAKLLHKGIGYIRFSSFDTDTKTFVQEAITALDNPPAIIIDLRGNRGGLISEILSVARLLVSEKTLLGSMDTRGINRYFDLPQRSSPYKTQIVILIDSSTCQAGEMFAAGLQESGRAMVVGERSAGDVVISTVLRMPNNAFFKCASAIWKTPKGVQISAQGVVPDMEVKRSRADLLKASDPQLDAALKQINKVTSPK